MIKMVVKNVLRSFFDFSFLWLPFMFYDDLRERKMHTYNRHKHIKADKNDLYQMLLMIFCEVF